MNKMLNYKATGLETLVSWGDITELAQCTWLHCYEYM